MNTYVAHFEFAPDSLSEAKDILNNSPVPHGITILSKYVYLGQNSGFVIFQCANHADLHSYAKLWRNHLDLEIQPIKPY